MASLMLEVGLN